MLILSFFQSYSIIILTQLKFTAETFCRFPKLRKLDLGGLSTPSGTPAFSFVQKYFGKELIPISSWSRHERILYSLRLAYEVACGAPSLNQVDLRYSNGGEVQGLIISRDQMTGAVKHVKHPHEAENKFQIVRWPM